MAEQTAQVDVVYRDAILKRLVQHFLNADDLPSRSDETEVVTFELLHHLCRYVVVEGYGQ